MIRNIMAEAASSMRCPPGASISEECNPFLPNAPVYASASSDMTPVVMSAILELETNDSVYGTEYSNWDNNV
ncbi:hypothetical protein QQP08_001118 [Theobroma cacao]|nr:hypothetical protein QQP08_001118 [Theobroma cacao]